MSHRPSLRRRGGQPGNVNRLRHGIYSRHLSGPASGLTGQAPDSRFQLALARKRMKQILRLQESAAPHDWISYERGILRCLSLICSLLRATDRARLSPPIDLGQGDGHPFIGILDSIRLFDAETSEHPREDLFPIRTSGPIPKTTLDLPLESPIRTANFSSIMSPTCSQARSDDDPDE